MYKSHIRNFPYFPTSSRGGGTGTTNASNVQTEYSEQTVTMTFLKLFVKVFTSILLIFTMKHPLKYAMNVKRMMDYWQHQTGQ